jgi:hypothetical protein
VAGEVGANVRLLESGSFSYANGMELARSHKAIDAPPRDPQDTGDVGDREQLLQPIALVLWRSEMCAHESTLPLKAVAKSGHNDELTKKEHAHYSDELEAGLLGSVLADDDHFLSLVAALAATARHERRSRAWEQARDYAPYEGPHRALIAKLLLVVAEAEWRDPPRTIAAQRRTLLANLAGRAVWAEAPLEDGDAQRVRERRNRLREGALYVARFGARKCIACGSRLRSHSTTQGRPNRRFHCSQCEEKLSAKIRSSQRDAMRDVLDAATGQRRARRAKRRAPAP